MPLIKLGAIDSTNDFLKQLSKESEVKDYTIVIANEQTKGKGQMGAKWVSEAGKNLTMSILVNQVEFINQNIYDFNVAVAVSVHQTLKNLQIPKITIKWPNDIMSDSKKVAGILIENSLKSDGSFIAIVGIGLNLNQTNFENLPQATSLKCITGEIFVPEDLANLIKDSLKANMHILKNHPDWIWKEYHDSLFKKGYPATFEYKDGKRFMGIIQKVTPDGKLEVLLDSGNVGHFEVKELKMLY